MSEALRQAIGSMAFILDAMKPPGKIKIERDGETSELKLL